MPIIGINLKSVSANIAEKAKVEGNISVNSSPTVKNVEKKSMGKGLKDALIIAFEFVINYDTEKKDKKKEPIGNMKINGEVIYYTEKEDEIIEKWKKEKKLDDDIAVEVLNALFKRCLTLAISLSVDLRLPSPLKFPEVKPKDQSEYIG